MKEVSKLSAPIKTGVKKVVINNNQNGPTKKRPIGKSSLLHIYISDAF